MKYCLLLMVAMLLITTLPLTSFSQNVPYYLNPKDFTIGFSMSSLEALTEDTETRYYGQIGYGLPNKLGIRLGGDVMVIKYIPHEFWLNSWSVPPVYGFTVGLYRIDKFIGKVDYWGNVDFDMRFVRVLDYFKNVIIRSNATYLTPTAGLMCKIPIGKHVAFIPFSGIYYVAGMITTKSYESIGSINDNDIGFVFGADLQISFIAIRGIVYYSNKYLTTTPCINILLNFRKELVVSKS